MSDQQKTHYRKVFKSDHLGVADLEDLIEAKNNLIFTVKHVRQEINARVAGKKGNFNIAYFEEDIKPFVLNAGNSKIMKDMSGGSSFVEDWGNIVIQLYIDKNVRFGPEVTGGVRINPTKVKVQKKTLMANSREWANAVNACRAGNLDKVLEHMSVSAPVLEQLKQEAANVA